MKKGEKSFFVANLAEELKSAKSTILINFSGMGVKTQQELKKRLSEVNARMMVVKNTLFKLAGKEAKIPKETLTDSVLAGQTALILADEDPISPLQILAKFTKEFEVPQLKVGIVEGYFQDKEALITLSKLPGKEALVTQAVGAIGAPIYSLMGTLQGNLQKLVFVLNQAKLKGGE
jgi:large subunit ribosomal protein L10